MAKKLKLKKMNLQMHVAEEFTWELYEAIVEYEENVEEGEEGKILFINIFSENMLFLSQI